MVRVVFRQHLVDGQPLGGQALPGGPVHNAPSGVGGAVGAVRPQGEDQRILQPGDPLGGGEGQFLIPPSQSVSGEMDHRLPSGQEGQRAPVPLVGADNGGQEGARLLGLAAQLVGEKHRLIAQLPAGRPGGGAQLPHAAGDHRLHVVQGLGGLLSQQGHRPVRQRESVLLHHLQGLGAGGPVRTGGTGGDHIQGVPQNVREHHGVHPGRGAQLGKPPPFYGGQPLADGVHLHNVRPAAQQRLRQLRELLRRDQGGLEQGGAASRHQKHHRVLGLQVPHQLHGRLGPPEGALVRDRVSPLINGAAGDVPPAVAVLGHHHAGLQPLSQQPGGAVGHLPGRLSDGRQEHPAGAEVLSLQGPGHRPVRQAGGKRALNDLLGIRMNRHGQLLLVQGVYSARPEKRQAKYSSTAPLGSRTLYPVFS